MHAQTNERERPPKMAAQQPDSSYRYWLHYQISYLLFLDQLQLEYHIQETRPAHALYPGHSEQRLDDSFYFEELRRETPDP